MIREPSEEEADSARTGDNYFISSRFFFDLSISGELSSSALGSREVTTICEDFAIGISLEVRAGRCSIFFATSLSSSGMRILG